MDFPFGLIVILVIIGLIVLYFIYKMYKDRRGQARVGPAAILRTVTY